MSIINLMTQTVLPPRGQNFIPRKSRVCVIVTSRSCVRPIPLGPGSFSFGSSIDCDFLLSGVDAPLMFSLEVQPSGLFTVQAHERLSVNTVALPAGEARSKLRTASITCGDIIFDIRSSRSRFSKVAAVGLLSSLAFVAPLAFSPGFHASVAPGHGPSMPRLADGVSLGLAASTVQNQAPSLLISTRERLAMLGFSVDLQQDNEGRYSIAGIVFPEKQGLLKDSVSNFLAGADVDWKIDPRPTNAQPKASALPVVAQAAPPPDMRIVSIVLHPRPAIKVADGRTLTLGAQARGGWTVSHIGLEHVLLKNGSAVHRLDF